MIEMIFIVRQKMVFVCLNVSIIEYIIVKSSFDIKNLIDVQFKLNIPQIIRYTLTIKK